MMFGVINLHHYDRVFTVILNVSPTPEIDTYGLTLARHDSLPIRPSPSLKSPRSSYAAPTEASKRPALYWTRPAALPPIPAREKSLSAVAWSSARPDRKSTRLNSSH